MRIAAFWLVTLFIAMVLPVQAIAADAYNPQNEVVSDLNRIKPLQNPDYDTAQDVLDRRVLDRKSKVVGSVDDIILNQNGNISFLDVEFDRMQLGRPVFVNYSTFNVKPVSNGYAMTFDSKEIEELYPSLLANIDTAAGEDENAMSLNKIKGLEVWTTGGKKIGTVNDVLFGANGQRAEALYVTLTTGNLRGDGVAIPYNQANFEQAASLHRVTIDDTMASAMITYATAN